MFNSFINSIYSYINVHKMSFKQYNAIIMLNIWKLEHVYWSYKCNHNNKLLHGSTQSSSSYLSQPIIPMAWLEPKEVFKFLKLTELLNNCRTSKVLIPFFSMYIISTVNQYRPIPLVKLYIYFIYIYPIDIE